MVMTYGLTLLKS